MSWKKVAALLFGLMLVTTGLAFSGVSAAGGSVTVILVSDNEADSALAEYLANLTGAVVVTTPWGVYSPDVTALVMAHAPDRVVIIGGPDAVLEQYETDLMDLNTTVERWWGPNRYGTNLAVIGNATATLGLRFEDEVFVAPGNDTAAIRVAIRRAAGVHGVVVYTNGTGEPSRVLRRLGIKPWKVVVVISPLTEGILGKFRAGGGCNASVTEVKVNVTAETALGVINMSRERIRLAKELLANVTLPPQLERTAERMLLLAERELNASVRAYEKGNYGRAYGLAMASKSHAEFVIKIASREWRMKVRFDPAMRYRVFLNRVEIQLQLMESAGINVTELRELVEALRQAVEKGDYDVAHYLMQKIRMELVKLYFKDRIRFREHVVFPAHRRCGMMP